MKEDVGYLIKNIADKMRVRADANMKRENITFQQSKVIAYLAKNDGQSTQKQIENFLRVSHATVAGILTRMEKNGFLTSCVDAKDKRNKIVSLTDKSVELWQELRCQIAKNEKELLEGVTQQQKENFLQVLKIVYQNLNK